MYSKLLALLLPFIQLGFTYYISIQSLLLGLLLFSYKFKRIHLLGITIVLFFFLSKYMYVDFNTHDLLLSFREYFGFLLIILSTYGLKKINMEHFIGALKFVYFVIIMSVILQYLSIIIFQSIPAISSSWYIINGLDEENINLALEHGTRLRPFSFFGEPSYAATIIVTINYLLGKFNKNFIYDLTVLLIIIALLESFTGFIIFSIILFFRYKIYILQKKEYLIIIIPIIITILFFSQDTEILIRLSGLFTGEIDSSTSYRLLRPFYFIEYSFSQHFYLGISHSEFIKLIDTDSSGLDNGLLNLFLFYGLGAFVILIYIYFKINNLELFILFILIIQGNGAVFSFDKVVLFTLIIGITKQITMNKRQFNIKEN